MRGARDTAMQAVDRDGAQAARQPHSVDNLGHGADGAKLVLVPGHEEHPLLFLGDVDGKGQRHVRKNDSVFQGNQQQGCHRFSLHIYLQDVSKDSDCSPNRKGLHA